MEYLISRLGWFLAAAPLVAYCIYLVAGNIVNAQAAGLNDPIPVRDSISINKHSLSGMVMVATPCDELLVKTRQVDQVTYALDFTTWREPSITCGNEQTPRSFRTTIFAPSAGVYFIATLDGTALPIGVIAYVEKQ